MAGSLKVLACTEQAADGSCTVQAWIDPPTVIPTLTAEEGAAIGIKLLGLYVAIKVLTFIRQIPNDRIGG